VEGGAVTDCQKTKTRRFAPEGVMSRVREMRWVDGGPTSRPSRQQDEEPLIEVTVDERRVAELLDPRELGWERDRRRSGARHGEGLLRISSRRRAA
jgi:hypothetical protein